MNIFRCLVEPVLSVFRNSAKKEPTHDVLNPGGAQIPTPNSEPTTRELPLTLITRPSPENSLAPPTPNGLTPTYSVHNSDTSSRKSDDGSESQLSRSRSDSNSKLDNALKDKLRIARREWPERSHKFFVPRCDQESLITEHTVKGIIQTRRPEIGEEEAGKYAKKTCQSARQLFAILALIKKGSEICPLLEEGVSDEDLPLHRTDSQGPFALQRRAGTHTHIETLGKWNDRDLEKFDRIQWWMVAPFFEGQSHYQLEESATLPFVSFQSDDEPKVGGYSEVYSRRLHPAHHNFWKRSESEDDEPLVAVKRLHSPDETEFKKEETILKALSPKNHPHLINLLATFEHKKKYHLLFPYADSNLRKYWEDRPHPSFDEPTVMWSLEQMVGIASALLLIHNFRVTYPLLPSGPGKVRLPKDTKLSVGPPGEEFYGRHGDIKPENILWFKRVQGPGGRGVLQIADFGLGRFHGRDSRSGISPSKVVSSPTYEPPECKLHKPVSRSYDIWSLGCLFLEFVTWLLKGSAEINGFADFRGRLSSIGINEDNFFTVTNDGSEAVVREKVTEWVNQLHEHEKCSELIHDLLKLTMSKLLVVDSKDRASAIEISQQLEKYLKKAKSDKQYLLAPVPSPKQAPPAPDSPKSHSRKSVTFSNQVKDTTPVNGVKSPRDLVFRNAGTPGFKSRPSGTWPQAGSKKG